MPKKVVDPDLQDPEFLEMLAKIEETKKMKDRILAETRGAKEEELKLLPDDICKYIYKKPDDDHYYPSCWKNFHVKCFDAGSEELRSWGYEFQQVGHFSKTDKSKARVGCNHCKGVLDEEEAKRMIQAQKDRLEQKHLAWERKKARQLEREKELVLLGKL